MTSPPSPGPPPVPSTPPTRGRLTRDTVPYVVGVALGLGYGILARFVFATEGHTRAALTAAWAGVSLAFMVLVPFALGALTAALVPTDARHRWARFAVLPLLPSLLMFVIAMALAWEGAICLVFASPLFLFMAMLGGILMGALRVGLASRNRKGTAAFAAVAAAAPYLFAPVEARLPAPDAVREVSTSVEVAADPATVWAEIVRVPEIRADELAWSPFHAIGIPRPREATLDREAVGGRRLALFEGGIRFVETVTEWRPRETFAFDIVVDADTVGPEVLDRHVRVGGAYFDVLHGRFVVQPAGEGVVLHLASRHRLTTRLNPYAALWTDAVMADIQRAVCRVVKARAEARAARRTHGISGSAAPPR